MSKIQNIKAREILDSRGNPTVEVDLELSNGIEAQASVPSGASTGSREALELRDGDKKRYLGKGVEKAIGNIENRIRPILIGKDVSDIIHIDECMLKEDATEEKKNLGANAILAVSMAATRAGASLQKLPLFEYLRTIYYKNFYKKDAPEKYTLPTPLMNVLNGGAHADNNISIQEFMIVPGNKASFKEALRSGAEVFHHLKKILKKESYSTNVGDEGGFAPNFSENIAVLNTICEAICAASYELKKDMAFALDVAATEFQTKDNVYELEGAPKSPMSSKELVLYYGELMQRFPIVSLEDALGESDWEGWKLLTEHYANKVNLVGDDLFVTNAKILQKGIKENIANAILIKLNQIGTVTETLETIALAQLNNYNTIISHRSGETEDSFLADLSVATEAKLVKTGSLSRGERIAKYNRLLRIEEMLGEKAQFLGLAAFERGL